MGAGGALAVTEEDCVANGPRETVDASKTQTVHRHGADEYDGMIR